MIDSRKQEGKTGKRCFLPKPPQPNMTNEFFILLLLLSLRRGFFATANKNTPRAEKGGSEGPLEKLEGNQSNHMYCSQDVQGTESR